jgi:hypothetical protein
MDTLEFSKKQTVIWFNRDREVGESTFFSGEKLRCEILCKEENLPKKQNDPIYIYTVRNQRGQIGVVFAYLHQPVREVD